MSPEYSFVLDILNYFFTTVFAIEAFLKIIANGWNYFGSNWNRFDFFVVISSFFDIAMSMLADSNLKFPKVAP